MCLEKRNSVEMNLYIEVVCFLFLALFNNSTFEESDAANDCSINSEGGGILLCYNDTSSYVVQTV